MRQQRQAFSSNNYIDALEENNIELIKHWLDTGQLNVGEMLDHDDEEKSPLNLALYAGSHDALNLLLDYGADIYEQVASTERQSLFAEMLENYQFDAALWLLDHGDAVDYDDLMFAMDALNASPEASFCIKQAHDVVAKVKAIIEKEHQIEFSTSFDVNAKLFMHIAQNKLYSFVRDALAQSLHLLNTHSNTDKHWRDAQRAQLLREAMRHVEHDGLDMVNMILVDVKGNDVIVGVRDGAGKTVYELADKKVRAAFDAHMNHGKRQCLVHARDMRRLVNDWGVFGHGAMQKCVAAILPQTSSRMGWSRAVTQAFVSELIKTGYAHEDIEHAFQNEQFLNQVERAFAIEPNPNLVAIFDSAYKAHVGAVGEAALENGDVMRSNLSSLSK